MLKFVLLACLIAYVLAAAKVDHPTHGVHTAHPHPTHDAHTAHPHPTHAAHVGANDAFKFHYDDASGMMIMTTHTHCYLMALTDAEKMDVKDALKKEMLELMMVSLAADSSKQTAVVDTSTLDHNVASHCHKLAIAKLTH